MNSEVSRYPAWVPGDTPVAVVMISFNEAHNMQQVLDNLKGFAQEVFLLDSFSTDDTVEIALQNGVFVMQHEFRGFGPQWNFALDNFPVSAPWTMKLDPDERISDTLKAGIRSALRTGRAGALSIQRRLWFMGRPLSVTQQIIRVWPTGRCRFSDVSVNEHPIVSGEVLRVGGELEHHDSPDLHHWVNKQNMYTSAEALMTYRGEKLSAAPKLFGTPLQRRMWLKSKLVGMPFRSVSIFLYCFFLQGGWRAGRVGFAWAVLRVYVYGLWAAKVMEMRLRGKEIDLARPMVGAPHPGAVQK